MGTSGAQPLDAEARAAVRADADARPSSAQSTSPTAPPLPLMDLRRLHHPLEEALAEAFARVLRSGRYHLGPETSAFEAEFAAHEGAPFGVACGSGSDALYLALRALGIGSGDTVATVSNSFMATAESIVRTGASVLFVEPHPESLTLDPEDLDRALGEVEGLALAAVIPVHLYGRLADIDGIRGVLDQRGLHSIPILGDAAQAHGAPQVAARTPIACYSFYPAKNLGALGDGGIVLTHDEELAASIRSLRNHGRSGKHSVEAVGLNSRFDEIQAATLRIKLRELDGWNAERRALAKSYGEQLGELPGLKLPAADPSHVFHLYVVQVTGGREARDQLQAQLSAAGIGTGLHYPVATHQMAPYSSARPLPITEELCDQVLSLPLFPGMRPDEVERVCVALHTALNPTGGRT